MAAQPNPARRHPVCVLWTTRKATSARADHGTDRDRVEDGIAGEWAVGTAAGPAGARDSAAFSRSAEGSGDLRPFLPFGKVSLTRSWNRPWAQIVTAGQETDTRPLEGRTRVRFPPSTRLAFRACGACCTRSNLAITRRRFDLPHPFATRAVERTGDRR